MRFRKACIIVFMHFIGFDNKKAIYRSEIIIALLTQRRSVFLFVIVFFQK